MPTLRKTERGWMRHQNSSPDFTVAIVRPRLENKRPNGFTRASRSSAQLARKIRPSPLPIVHVAYLAIFGEKGGEAELLPWKTTWSQLYSCFSCPSSTSWTSFVLC